MQNTVPLWFLALSIIATGIFSLAGAFAGPFLSRRARDADVLVAGQAIMRDKAESIFAELERYRFTVGKYVVECNASDARPFDARDSIPSTDILIGLLSTYYPAGYEIVANHDEAVRQAIMRISDEYEKLRLKPPKPLIDLDLDLRRERAVARELMELTGDLVRDLHKFMVSAVAKYRPTA